MARRQHLTLLLVLAVALLLSISYYFSADRALARAPAALRPAPDEDARAVGHFAVDIGDLPSGILSGDSIAPKLENATLKAELGRSTWKFLHTMVARFPEEPTPDDRKALETFMHLFGRLYPCGDCARHFRQLLAKYPPQTSSRNAAAGWLCFAHNQVNERLEKPSFDCNDIGDFYDCGCGDEKKKKGETKEAGEEDGGEEKESG
ncbi:FAD-linked sulfhydryl oxidase ERV2 [Escovopsis weberi]|uniref:Sulfhydryl oxidase n=1 Tax=Escovopsis weberi TaxID=150374 RepID=A0A0M8MUF8_ESCWE|nr:FAD-linked sulfhydryl oxidase ERV2 [Escovopsis weberi]